MYGISSPTPGSGSGAHSSVAAMQANGAHPTRWDDFVGQDAVKLKLRTAARSAAVRGARMPHLIISSPEAGVGKTTLALLAAAEAGNRAKVVSGVVTRERAIEVFEDLGDGGVLIWDEFQTAVSGTGGKKNVEWLYLYAQHGVFADEDDFIEVPAVTIIAATTHVGDLPTAVKQRFQILTLAPYTAEEAVDIARSTWEKLAQGLGLPEMSDETCLAVARAASGRPRFMQRVWENVRDLIVTEQLDYDEYSGQPCTVDLTVALEWAGLTGDGLTESCQRYMEFLLRNKQRPRGAETIARSTGIAKSELVETEALLMEKGYVADTGRGRELTREGRNRAKELLAVAA